MEDIPYYYNSAYPNQSIFATSDYFSQINVVDNYMYGCDPDTDKVQVTTPTVTILQTKIVDTIKNTSLEGQNLSGKKIIITGHIKLTLVLTRFSCSRYTTTTTEKLIPFSTYIVIPINTCENSSVWIDYAIEDSSAYIIENNRLFTSVSLLLSYHNCEL